MVAAEAARLRMAVEAEVTHPPTAEVAVVDVLPAAEAAGMPRLRAAVGATAAEAGPKMVAEITRTTKFLFRAGKRYAAQQNWAAFSFGVDPTKSCGSETCLKQTKCPAATLRSGRFVFCVLV